VVELPRGSVVCNWGPVGTDERTNKDECLGGKSSPVKGGVKS